MHWKTRRTTPVSSKGTLIAGPDLQVYHGRVLNSLEGHDRLCPKAVSMKSLWMENSTFSSCYLSIRYGLNKPSFIRPCRIRAGCAILESCRVGQLIILLKPEIVNR